MGLKGRKESNLPVAHDDLDSTFKSRVLLVAYQSQPSFEANLVRHRGPANDQDRPKGDRVVCRGDTDDMEQRPLVVLVQAADEEHGGK